jgi:hypothetical protein
MFWVLFGLLSTLAAAVIPEINRRVKLNPHQLNFWRSLTASIMMLPALPWMYWPEPSVFYLAVFCYASFVLVGMIIILTMAARHNGRVASMFMPVKIFAAFILWILVEPGAWGEFISSPARAWIIGFSCLIMIGCMQALRANDNGFKAFLAVAPVGVMYAVVDIASRIGIAPYDLLPATLTFMFLSYVLSTFMTGAVLAALNPEDEKMFSMKALKAGTAIGFVHIVLLFGATMCVILAPNPAYYSLIQMLLPVFLMAYHKLIGLPDDASPKVGLIMVAAAMLMIWATQL